MSLPSGYTQLEYIESDNSSYLDTGVTMGKTDSVTLEEVLTPFGTSDTRYTGANGYMQIAITSSGYSINGTAKKSLGTKDKLKCIYTSTTESLYINGALVESSDWSSYNGANVKIGLFKMGDAVNAWYSGKAHSGKCYGASIIKNGVKVREFIPCKNASGVAGMWDDVSKSFFSSASSFAFIAGSVYIGTHKTLVNGTVYEVKGGKCLVNGTVYNILKGRTLIGGTGYDITFPSAGTKLSALGVGQSVFTNVSGVKKEFLVVHQGLPSSLYDSSCDGTWLLMKDIYEMRQWNSNSELLYENSSIHSYLNSTFLSLFDANIQSAIKQAKIPYLKGGKGGSVQSGANGLSCKVFLLGGYELNFRNIFPADGAGLDGFAESIINNPAYLATYNGTLTKWWLRSITTLDINYAGLVRGYTYDSASVTESNGIRPCIILPSDALVNEEFELIA